MFRHHHTHQLNEAPALWSRRRLWAALAAVAVAASAVLAGVGTGTYWLLTGTGSGQRHVPAQQTHHQSTPPARHRLADRPEASAAAPMPTMDPGAARPQPLSTEPAPVLRLPPATGVGPGGVPTGFPHTPAGALAQLAGIDQATLQAASIPAAGAIITGWAAPGGPTPATWSGTKTITEMLSVLGLAAQGSPDLRVTAIPRMGLIRPTVGAEEVIVCVDLAVSARLVTTARVAVADCQRMRWTGHRWVIGPGPEPAQSPSVWPGTTAAAAAGYSRLSYD